MVWHIVCVTTELCQTQQSGHNGVISDDFLQPQFQGDCHTVPTYWDTLMEQSHR